MFYILQRQFASGRQCLLIRCLQTVIADCEAQLALLCKESYGQPTSASLVNL